MKRGDVYWADLVPRSGSEQTGRRRVIVGVSRRIQPNCWMEIDYRDPDLNVFIARQARTYRH